MWINKCGNVEKSQDLLTMHKALNINSISGIPESYPHFYKKKQKLLRLLHLNFIKYWS